MKQSLHITTSFDQPGLLESLIERLACRRYDLGYGREMVPVNFEALETSSAETYVSGTIALSNKEESFNIPFITSMLFTCIKGKDDNYRLTWATTLS